jgi:hypothetical protein
MTFTLCFRLLFAPLRAMDRLLASPFLTPFHFASFEIVAPAMGPLFFAQQVAGSR